MLNYEQGCQHEELVLPLNFFLKNRLSVFDLFYERKNGPVLISFFSFLEIRKMMIGKANLFFTIFFENF